MDDDGYEERQIGPFVVRGPTELLDQIKLIDVSARRAAASDVWLDGGVVDIGDVIRESELNRNNDLKFLFEEFTTGEDLATGDWRIRPTPKPSTAGLIVGLFLTAIGVALVTMVVMQ